MLLGLVAFMVLGATVYGTRLTRTANAAFNIVQTQGRAEADRARRMSDVAQLATGVARELRNPLTSVKLLVQTGRKQGLSLEELSVVFKQVERMERSLNSFLDFARPARLEIGQCDLVNRDRCPIDRRHQSEPGTNGQGRLFPRRSLLPVECVYHRDSAAPPAERGHSRPGGIFFASI